MGKITSALNIIILMRQHKYHMQPFINILERVVQLKIRNLIIIDDETVDFSDLDEKKRKEITMQLNERAAVQIGYEKSLKQKSKK